MRISWGISGLDDLSEENIEKNGWKAGTEESLHKCRILQLKSMKRAK